MDHTWPEKAVVIGTEDVSDVGVVRVDVAGWPARIVTNRPSVAEWVLRSFGSWGLADYEPASVRQDGDVFVAGYVDGIRFREIAAAVDRLPYDTVPSGDVELRFALRGGKLLAYDGDQVAYTVGAGGVGVAGLDPQRVATASCRLVREALRGLLVHHGWVVLRTAAVERDNRVVLVAGRDHAGKASVVLQLASAGGRAVVATDRVFVRSTSTGALDVMSWPGAAAVDLGLLRNAGWFDAVAAARTELHPSTSRAVRDALARRRWAVSHDDEPEPVAYLFNDQLASLLDVPLGICGRAEAVLFTDVESGAAPRAEPARDALDWEALIDVDVEDRSSEVLGLRGPESDTAHRAVCRTLGALPRMSVTLGHDLVGNQVALTEVP